MYSQNNEQQIILSYFSLARHTPTLLDIGANDGLTFSNSLALIELGWKAFLLEPSPKAFAKLQKLHENKANVVCFNYGLSSKTGKQKFFESGGYEHGEDVALYSSTNEHEIKRWGDKVAFVETEANFKSVKSFFKMYDKEQFEFISIDTEGHDWEILSQIDLNDVGCKCLCIEWNSVPEMKNAIVPYCNNYGFKIVHENPENLILTR